MFKTSPAMEIFVYLLFVLLDMSRQLQVLSKINLLKINPSKTNFIKSGPINPSLDESSVYKYGKLCKVN